MSAPQQAAPQHTGPAQVTGAHECARTWSALTAAHARVAGQLGAALQRACGLTVTDFEILLRLDAGHSTGPGPATGPGPGPAAGQRVGDLTGVIRLSQPALSRAVARLADRGWLTRAGSPDDARCVLLTLTLAGRDILATATAVHATVIRQALLDRLTPGEQDVLARVLARVADG